MSQLVHPRLQRVQPSLRPERGSYGAILWSSVGVLGMVSPGKSRRVRSSPEGGPETEEGESSFERERRVAWKRRTLAIAVAGSVGWAGLEEEEEEEGAGCNGGCGVGVGVAG